MPSIFKRFSTIVKRDNADKKDKRKSLAVFPKSKDASTPKAELRSKGKKIVVVSGASVGLGAELVQRFAKEHGTFVIALDTGIAPSAELKKHLNEDVVAVRLELKEISKAVAEIEKLTGGRIDILVNSAVPAKHSAKSLTDVLHGDISSELSAMVTTPIAVTNALLPLLKKYTPPPPPMETAAMKEQAAAPPAVAAEEKEAAAPVEVNGVAPPPPPMETAAAPPAVAAEEKKEAAAPVEANGVAPPPPSAPVPASATEMPSATTTPPAAATETPLPAPTPSEAPTTAPNGTTSPDTNATTTTTTTAPPATTTAPTDAITSSDGNPVSKNELLVQKFLKDEVQDPKLLPHVEGKTYGTEAAKEGEEKKVEERAPVLVKNANAPVTLADVAPPPVKKDEEKEGVVVANGTTNGTATSTTTEAAKPQGNVFATTPAAIPTRAPEPPSFPANPIIAFLTLSRPAHAVFPPVPFATQSMAHAALHVALTKYAHDLAARGVVVVGVEVGGWDEADAIHTSTQATESIIHDLAKASLADNGKILHHHGITAPLLNWSSFKSNALL